MSAAAPPQVIGFERKPSLIVGEPRRRFVCGADSYSQRSTFPDRDEPIYRGEAPEGATCCVCGIDLGEL